MLSQEIIDSYELTIGIETHVQLKTKTKLFAGVDNDARQAEPNSLISPLCFGMPGTLPVLNEKVVELAVRAGLALNAEVAHFSKFDRKHYFYPDLPKGYQITQFDEPTVGKGEIVVHAEGKDHKVGITRAHIEEDAGKSTHPKGSDHSLVDLNRAGTPLLEIVSEPDIHSAAVARAYALELYLLMKYADVSDVDLFHGNMRFDVNVSVAKKGAKELGTRAEVKNINSFRAVEKAVEYEQKRQIELLEKGESIHQETRGWDDSKMKTFSQRSKEDAHDYRYFPDPDLPPIEIDDDFIEKIRSSLPILPPEIRRILTEAGIDDKQISTILSNEKYVDILLNAIDESAKQSAIKRLANWLTIWVQALADAWDEVQIEELTYSWLSSLSDLVEGGLLSSTAAKDVLEYGAKSKFNETPKNIANDLKLMQVSDSSEIEKFVDEVISENEKAAQDVRDGELKAIGFLVGQVMAKSKGQANPKMVQDLIRKKLGDK